MRYFLSLLTLLITVLPVAAQEGVTQTPKREKLLNGLPVVILERPGNVVARLVVRSGSTFDPAGKFGMSRMMSMMLLRSAGGWTAERLQEELADIGATIEVVTGWDSIELRATCASGANAANLLTILGQVAVDPKFREQEIEALKAEQKQLIEQEASAAAIFASHLLQQEIFGSHPYGHPINGDLAGIAAMKRPDFFEYYDRVFMANNAALVVVGNVSAERLLPVIKKAFGGWKKSVPPPYTFVPPAEWEGVRIRLVRKDLAESEVRIGAFGVKRTDSDYLPALVLAEALNLKLEKLGLRVTLHARKLRGYFEIEGASAAAHTTLSKALAEIGALKLDAETLTAAKSRVKSAYYEPLHGSNLNNALAEKWADLENYNYGANYMTGFATAVDRVSLENVQRLAGRLGQSLSVVVVGRVSAADYEGLGKVVID